MGEYSKAAIFFSETLATCTAIYLGEAIIANEVLAATKGRAMGWGFVALGFGLAFGIGKNDSAEEVCQSGARSPQTVSMQEVLRCTIPMALQEFSALATSQPI